MLHAFYSYNNEIGCMHKRLSLGLAKRGFIFKRQRKVKYHEES